MIRSVVIFLCQWFSGSCIYIFFFLQMGDILDDDIRKRRCMVRAGKIMDHGSDSQQVQDDIVAVYVLCASTSCAFSDL
jgi:hypothetical protein